MEHGNLSHPLILTFVAHYLPGDKSGGPVRTISNMVDQLGDKLQFLVVTSDRDSLDAHPYPNIIPDAWNNVGKAKVFYASPAMQSMSCIAKLVQDTPHDVLYLNSFFCYPFSIQLLLARRLGLLPKRSTVIAPRGELLDGMLVLKWWKKAPYIFLSRMAGLYAGLTWHASNPFEAESIKQTLKHAVEKIVVASNLPALPKSSGEGAEACGSVPGNPLRVCFLSRISPEKNLDYALHVLATVRVPVEFSIYGAVSDESYWRRCSDMILKLPANVTAHYHGKVDHANVWQTLANNDLFFFPTLGENYGHVVFEALSSGLPVLISDQTPWRDLAKLGVGWDLPLGSTEKCRDIIEAQAGLDVEQRKVQRNNAKSYAQRFASNTELLAANLALFRDLGQGMGSTATSLKTTPVGTAGKPYQICTNCVMDTSDPNISFDAHGRCDYCRNYSRNILPNWHTDERGELEFSGIAERIKKDGKGKPHDCIIGVSGGLDSSYATYIAKEKYGLRPLVFHVDAGWNTQQAVGNIEKLLNGLGLDLYTEVINWEEMKDLQVAFLKAQIPDQDMPQDVAFFSALYKFAEKHGIKYVLTGANFSTECCREPEDWGAYPGIDKTLIMDIHARFGKAPLDTFPVVDVFTYKLYYKYVLGMQIVKPLNYLPYIKKDAEKLLQSRFGWEKFQHKHHESRFTRFYEDYWMPKKFGYEKRRAHFSSLILTDQMTREEALARLSLPEMGEEFSTQEFEYVAGKLGLAVAELREIFSGPNKTFRDYKNKRYLIGQGARAMKMMGLENRLFR